MKTKIFTTVLAVILTLIISSGNAEAKGKEIRNVSILENATESDAKLESWMINELIWNRSISFDLKEEADVPVHLEAWMVHSSFWVLIPAEDEKITLEEWMLDNSNWIPVSVCLEPAKEKESVLESWMTDERNWK